MEAFESLEYKSDSETDDLEECMFGSKKIKIL